VRGSPETNWMRWSLEGGPGAVEDQRRRSFDEGGAARRARERRRPWGAVAGGPAGGGCGGRADLGCEVGAALRHRRPAAVLVLLHFFLSSPWTYSSPPDSYSVYRNFNRGHGRP
jgi:hypothetical protein